MNRPLRNRKVYALWILVVMGIGGASRLPFTEGGPYVYTEYAGDTFWALMIFLGIGFVFPTWKTLTVALCTLAFSFGVEFSQLIEHPWMNALRETIFGKLVLGSGFRGSDFVCYSAGCLMGVAGEWLGRRAKTSMKENDRQTV
ncbi:DUF2809 domain-containing protein [Kiritimatiellaeota bacterium B1221]|nr:DUF2809 domain-containing protein [Kiritimatiellaeota bacterium B1221]